MPVRRRRRLSERRSGQALVETALAAPFLVMLLLGGAQVGQIAYAQVSLDTAAREGAAAAATNPTATAQSWYPSSGTHPCTGADFNVKPVNPACAAVFNSGGFLDSAQFLSGNATATITIKTEAALAAFTTHVPPVRVMSQTCNGNNWEQVTVTVTAIPPGATATLNDSHNDYSGNNGPTVTSSNPTKSFCVYASNNVQTENITAQISNACPTASYSGATGTFSVSPQGPTLTKQIDLSQVACTTTSTTTATSSSTTSTSSTSSSTGTTSVSTLSVICQTSAIPANDYITVTVTYPVSIFVPFINQLFQTGPGLRTITTSVTYAIYPNCSTDGA